VSGGIKFPYVGEQADLWIPLRDDLSFADRQADRGVQGSWALLVPELDLGTAQERFDVIAQGLQQERPSDDPWELLLTPLGDYRGSGMETASWLLTATVAALFLVALVNGVNLLLVRASGRIREIAVRLALGASRPRLLRQFLVEGLLLGLIGGTAAVALAWGAITTVSEIIPRGVHYSSPFGPEIERRTLLFVLVASLIAGTILGLIPGLQVHRGRGDSIARHRGREDSPLSRRLRNGLVVSQVALSMTLLVAAGLLVNGFARLLSVDPGIDLEHVAVARLMPSPTRYRDGTARADFLRRLGTALEADPVVDGVTFRGGTPFTAGALQAEGDPPRDDQPRILPYAPVAPGYVRTMGTEIVEGRGFETADVGTNNTIIDQDLARFLWGVQNPVGRRFRMGDNREWLTVVGVARELTLMGRDQRSGPYQVLYPMDFENAPPRALEIFMRSSGSAKTLLPVFQQTLRSVDPEQSIIDLRTASDALAEEEEKPRFAVTLMTLLAGVAVALAAIGLYGVLACSVSRRSRELGVRIALGARRGRVRGMVLREGLIVATVGVALGIGGALFATRLIEQLLYEVEPGDPATFATTAALFLAVAAVASLVPAVRATRLNPVEVLRAD
jgi:putative ABC transport system permease protein